jgi:virulence-associated protein VagC
MRLYSIALTMPPEVLIQQDGNRLIISPVI